jgi:hypothetical protein
MRATVVARVSSIISASVSGASHSADLGVLPVENEVGLLQIGLRVFLYLLRREHGPGLRAARRIPDTRGVVTDHEHCGVPEILKLPQLF